MRMPKTVSAKTLFACDGKAAPKNTLFSADAQRSKGAAFNLVARMNSPRIRPRNSRPIVHRLPRIVLLIDEHRIGQNPVCMRRKRSGQNYREAISRLRGILRKKLGSKSLSQEWAEYKREELAIDDRKTRWPKGP